jgi:hypothetical protein
LNSLRKENFKPVLAAGREKNMKKKGIILFITMFVLAVLLVLIGAYFSGLLTEKKAADTEGYVLQALTLAEAGASHAQSELRERINTDLKARMRNIRMASVFQTYVTNNDALGFLHDYAYAAGASQFNVSDGKATVSVSALNLNTGIQGTYSADIIVTADEDQPPANPQGEKFVFYYKYSIESSGQITRLANNITRNIRLLQGAFSVTVLRDTFAKYALFTAHHSMPSGTIVWFTADTNFTGPVSTNDRFSFANNPSAHFTEEVTQHQTRARFYNNGWPRLMNADSNPPRDVPVFDKGFQRGVDIIDLESSLTQADLKREALGGTAEPRSNGIYVPNNGTNVIGAIYIRGNQGSHADDAIINMSVGANGPVYTITQGSTTETITIDYTNNQTTIHTGTGDVTYQGIPDGTQNEGILIYANDDIKSLYGTVERNSAVTVSAERDIIITNNLQYQDYTPDDPDTHDINELSAEGYNNLLGIISWGEDVRIATSAPDDIQIHGVVMAPHGIFSVDDYNHGDPRGIATLLGGSITDFYGPFGTFSAQGPESGYGRNFIYDARMLHGMAPPYFPYLSTFTSNESGLSNKLIWQDEGV